ncbi:MAG TPA: anhydro-N-acetylmuramic acid kinase [Ignavibacteria bacterium]|nr:anhydro-N-acetylmuramic acid kinase [Ignavibacteria bacterium]
MQNLKDVFNKESLNIIGILSGTSVDSVDIIQVTVKGSSETTNFEVKTFDSFKILPEIKEFTLNCSLNDTASVENICKLNFLIGHLFADCINKFLQKHNINKESIDLIGSHGQTIHHIPSYYKISDYSFKSTLQVGDISVIANKTGITTIGDFRTADIAVGGDGAPLVPYLDHVLFRDKKLNRILINIGGISNLTYLQAGGNLNDIIAFDCGPGNMLIDGAMNVLYSKQFDEDGKIAFSGKINDKLFSFLKTEDKYVAAKPPKSTGREHYGILLNKILEKFSVVGENTNNGGDREVKNIPKEDIIRTISEYTAYAIDYSIKNFINADIDEIILSGGGAKNLYVKKRLEELYPAKVVVMNHSGVTAENKEALLFALLANEAIRGNSANVLSVTGAKKNVILGKLSVAN